MGVVSAPTSVSRIPQLRLGRPTSGPSAIAPPRAPAPPLTALTSLRFFAALVVVLFHLRVMHILDGGPWWYQNFASIGYVGVNCFFVLSGFILVYTYGRTAAETGAGAGVDARRFWRARFARIYPAYLLSLLVTAPYFFHAVGHLEIPYLAWSQRHLTAACILTLGLAQAWVPQGALTWNAVCWSLSAEAFFYLLFPALLLWTRRLTPRGLGLAIAGCAAVSLAFSLLYVFLHPDGIDKVNSLETTLPWRNVLSYNPLVRLPEFVTGMLAGQLFLAGPGSSRLALPLVSIGLCVLVALTAMAGKIPNPLVSAGFLSPAFAALIYGLAALPADSASFLEWRWLVLLGEASYSLYLLHSFAISEISEATAGLPKWAQVLACLAGAIAASLICFRMVEQPPRKVLRPAEARPGPHSRPDR